MAIYISVLSTTMIVSLLGLTAMAVVRIERKQATAVNNRLLARSNARSAVELALRAIANNSSWRTAHANGVETTPLPLGVSATGSVSWILEDDDGSLTNADQFLRLKGVGRVGGAIQVSSVRLNVGEVYDDDLRHNYGSNGILGIGSDIRSDDLKSDSWWGQYFKPNNLPPDANGWRISRVDIVARRDNTNRKFNVRLRRAGAGNLPSGTLIDEVEINSSAIGTSMDWRQINFSSAQWLNVNQGVCLTLETTESQPPIEVGWDDNVSASNSALLRGNPTWNSWVDDDALEYRIYGYYTTSSGVQPVAGTWIWDVLD